MAGGKIVKKKASASANHYQGGIPFHKSKGQHILKNPMIVDTIVQKSGIKTTDVVLEIGPGTGNLTKKLLEAAKSVVAIELDPRMVLELQRRFQGTPLSNKLKVVQGDVLKCELPYFDICVANIPYQISSPLTFKLLSHRPAFRCAVIMFQREFAMRLVAQPGDNLYCRLSVNTQLLGRVSHLLKVGKNNFRPAPKVDSSVVRIEPRKPLPPAKNSSIFARKNYKTAQALKRSLKEDRQSETVADDIGFLCNIGGGDDASMDVDVGEGDEEMEIEDEEMEEGSDFKDRVLSVLKQGDFEEKRSAKLSQVDFLYLLSLFNMAGIHFSQ